MVASVQYAQLAQIQNMFTSTCLPSKHVSAVLNLLRTLNWC